MRMEVKFPCGYEIKFRTSFLDMFTLDGSVKPEICSIHGKKCCRTPYLGMKQSERDC